MGFLPDTNLLGALAGLHPIQPQNTFLGALLALDRKPRNRSEWESRFAFWQKPASDTEEAKITAAANRVRYAMRHSAFLPGRTWTIVKQGSYHNNTNTRTESDIDLGMCLTDAFFTEGPQNDYPSMTELGREPLPFTFDQYKSHIAWCLQQEFGAGAVTIGKKAIHLNKNDNDKIKADVVPAYVFQKFGARIAPYGLRGDPQMGIAFISENKRITNFPDHHYANGCAKNDRTGRRYKRVVRIIKRLRNHIADNPEVPQAIRNRAQETASFLIESLVYNCPDTLFGHTSIYDDVIAVLHYLSLVLNDPGKGNTLLTLPLWCFWQEVNGMKRLFGLDQPWSLLGAAEFIDGASAYVRV